MVEGKAETQEGGMEGRNQSCSFRGKSNRSNGPSVVHPVTSVVELSASGPRYGQNKVQNSEDSGIRLWSTHVCADVIQQPFL